VLCRVLVQQKMNVISSHLTRCLGSAVTHMRYRPCREQLQYLGRLVFFLWTTLDTVILTSFQRRCLRNN